jgi:hypothetical protein
VNKGHGRDPLCHLPEGLLRFLIAEYASLHLQEALNDLEVVFDPMVDFPQQYFFFMKSRLDLLLVLKVFGDVMKSQNRSRSIL